MCAHICQKYFFKKMEPCKPGVVAHTCNPINWEAEAGRFLRLRPSWSVERIPGQPELHRETMFWKTKKKMELCMCKGRGILNVCENKDWLWVFLVKRVKIYEIKINLIKYIFNHLNNFYLNESLLVKTHVLILEKLFFRKVF